MINKRYKNGFAAVIAICVILMIAGGFWDYALTDKLYNPQSGVGIIFEAFSSFPVYFFIPVMGACMIIRNNDSMPVFGLGAAMLIFSCCYYMYSSFKAMEDRSFIKKTNPFICGIIGGLIAALIFIALRNIDRKKLRKVQAMCAFAFAYMFCYLGVFVVLKVLFGRDRYEDIIKGGESVFARWFKPDFFSSGSSFPSGHVGAAMGILTLLLLPFLFEFFKDKKWLIFALCYVYVGFTAYTRLVMGRHFLSDVAFAMLLMTVIFMVLSPFFERLYRKEFLPSYRKKRRDVTLYE